ncbi:hypothetical protein BT69DRAFT_1262291 [Atractiella rhizophila]|nr:hypothetical protein BT69DRAFT_1262291 [Atractiella rhizophila]
MHFIFLSVVSSVFSLVSARTNDWSVPCLSGQCSYDLPVSFNKETNSRSLGSMRVWGNTSALSDITSAAGWTILDCNATSLSQDIRIVCPRGDEGCNNLFSGRGGGVNKLVRLPESCGKMPFARVARVWTHKNQSIPSNVKLAKSGRIPTVHGLAIDTNFAAVDPSTVGTVNIAIQGSNLPGQADNATVTPADSSEAATKRGLFDFITDALNKFNQIKVNESEPLDHLSFSKNLTVLDESISCSLPDGTTFDAGFDVDVSGRFEGDVTIGIVATGTIVPPVLDNFAVYAGLSASLGGTLDIKAHAGASVAPPDITIFQANLAGLNFPGILNVGPSFNIVARAKAGIQVDADLKVDLSYSTQDTILFFPPNDQFQSGGTWKPNPADLSLSVSPEATASGTLEFHLIPSISIGLDALSIAKAEVFLNLDSSATLNANLAVTGPEINQNLSVPITASDPQFSGCLDIAAGLDVNAGASADFFDIFKKDATISLFSKDFQILNKCFGDDATATTKRLKTRRAVDNHRNRQIKRLGHGALNVKRQDSTGLNCIPQASSDLFNIADTSVTLS